MHIPPYKYSFTDQAIRSITADIEQLLRSGDHLTMGSHGKALETCFEQYSGTRHVVSVTSGTAALEIILRALDVTGGQVIVPTNTFGATCVAVLRAGAAPVFADTADDLSVDVSDVEKKLSPSVRAVIAVHIGGHISPHTRTLADLCRDRGIPLVEDAAHAIGARLDGQPAGTFGVASAFSLFSTKVATAGEGGLIATDDDHLAQTALHLRDHAKEPDGTMTTTGYNWRLTELQAIVARTQIETLDEIIDARNCVAAIYDEMLHDLSGVRLLHPAPGGRHNRYKYVLFVDNALPARIRSRLQDQHGIELGGEVYRTPCHRQHAFQQYAEGPFPGADRYCATHICPPIYPNMTVTEAEHVGHALRAVLADGAPVGGWSQPPASRSHRTQLYAWVYENNQWGRSPQGDKYYSDSPPELTAPYRRYVSDFIASHGSDIRRVVDIGCGDFMISSGIDMGNAHYIGVDIYDDLIAHNRGRFGDDRHEFLTRDIVEDDLPAADLCLVSMVLYLMSHQDVLAVLPKLRQYRYVLVTDGQPDIPPERRRNIDKPTGRHPPRDLFGNGFYLELPPFNLDLEVVSEYQIPSGEILRTVLIKHPPEQARKV